MPTVATPPKTMQAIRYQSIGQISLQEITCPQPGDKEVLIQIEAAVTNGTDHKTYRRGHPLLLKQLPAPFGHECVGKIVAIGAAVTQFSIGQRVVPANSAPCGSCFFCQKQQVNLCENLSFLNGAYAQYLLIPEDITTQNLYVVPDDIAVENLVSIESVAVCLNGLGQLQLHSPQHIGILGAGPIARIMAVLCTKQGHNVSLMGRNPNNLENAQAFLQANHCNAQVVSLTESLSGVKADTPEEKGFDVLIECTGQPEGWLTALQLVRRGGQALMFGGCPKDSFIEVSTAQIHYDEVTLLGAFHHTPQCFKQAVAMVVNGELNLSPLVTDKRPLEKLGDAFELMSEGKANKVLITP